MYIYTPLCRNWNILIKAKEIYNLDPTMKFRRRRTCDDDEDDDDLPVFR